jgi:outer membrane protein OmpA-like peptidoglycan-associated protein
MRRLLFSFPLLALTALPFAAHAQQSPPPGSPSVQMFEQVPTLDELRLALMPETQYSTSRALRAGPKGDQPRRQNLEKAVGVPINYPPNGVRVPDRYEPYIDRISELLKAEPKLAVRVEGHTDAQGSDAYNKELSRKRAEYVAEQLTERGVGRDRLSVVGKGKSEPLSSDPYDSWNRRVQIVRTQ